MKDANADTEGFSDDVNGHCTASGCVAPEHAHAHRLPRHAVCMTGLERGMPFAFGNVRVAEPAWMFCKLKITNISEPGARTCIPRMQRRTPCSRLTCTGGGIDCNCATDNSTCTHYDPRARKNATHWYCQDVPRGNQLSLDGELYGGRYGTSGLE